MAFGKRRDIRTSNDVSWKDEENVIKMANDSHYGLAGYIWTHDIGKGLKTAHSVRGWMGSSKSRIRSDAW